MKNTIGIIISRADSIGDVILTLPVAGVIKKNFPNTSVAFLCSAYAKPVVETCEHVDTIIDVTDFLNSNHKIDTATLTTILHILPRPDIAWQAKKINIALRIGTTNRWYHWLTCNSLVKLSRKNSDLHEAQLNLKLLKPLHVKTDYTLQEIANFYGCTKLQALKKEYKDLLSHDKYNLILHPKSQGSAREWPVEHFISFIKMLDADRYTIFISGTEKEKSFLQNILNACNNVISIIGKMNLSQFISFINQADGLMAASTGPLHIAAALGKDAFGIFSPMRPVHPGRWAPIGKHAQTFVVDKPCSDCRKGNYCHCIAAITPEEIKAAADAANTKKF